MGFDGAIIPILAKKGINNGIDAVNLPADQSPDARNVRFRFRSVQKRDGYTRYIDPQANANAVTGAVQLALTSGTNQQVICSGNDIFRENAGAWTSIKGALTLSSNQDYLWQFAQLNNILLGVNNVDVPIQWSGTGNATTNAAAPDTAKAIATYKNRAIMLNVIEGGVRNKGRVRWSALNDGTSWPAANVQTFLNQTGDDGSGFGKVRDQLFVFFERSIHQMSDTGDSNTPFIFPTITPTIGSVSGHAIVSVDDAIFFPSYRGIYKFDGSGVQYVSQPIEATWRGINVNRLGQIVGVHNEKFDEVWFAISTGSNTQNDRILVYDYVHDVWTEFDAMAANIFALFRETIPLNPVWGNYTGRLMKANSNTFADDGAAITAWCSSKPMDLAAPQRYRKVRRLEAVVDTSSTTGALLKHRHAYELSSLSNEGNVSIVNTGALWDTAIWDTDTFAPETQTVVRVYPQGNGRWFQAQVRSDQLNVGMNVSELYAFVKGEGIREVR